MVDSVPAAVAGRPVAVVGRPRPVAVAGRPAVVVGQAGRRRGEARGRAGRRGCGARTALGSPAALVVSPVTPSADCAVSACTRAAANDAEEAEPLVAPPLVVPDVAAAASLVAGVATIIAWIWPMRVSVESRDIGPVIDARRGEVEP